MIKHIGVILLAVLITGCEPDSVPLDEEHVDQIPLCSTGKKVLVDPSALPPEEYKKLPWQVRKLGFRMKICRSDKQDDK